MPKVTKLERYVTIGYTLMCGFERATALADDLNRILKHDKGFDSAQDKTIGWDGDYHSHVAVTYCTLADAVRLDYEVRQLLSRNVDYTCVTRYGTSYSGRGPTLTVDMTTTVTPR